MPIKRYIEKRAWRKVRSKLKERILNGGKPSNELLKRYNLTLWFKLNKSTKKTQNESQSENTPDKTKKINVPENLSFIEDHQAAFNFLAKIDSIVKNKNKAFNLHFSHANTKNIDLAASFLFDEKIDLYKKGWLKKGVKIIFSGKISTHYKTVNNFLLSFGLLERLGISVDQFKDNKTVDKDYHSKYLTHKFIGNGRYKHLSGNAAKQLADYFNSCLKHNNYKLQEDAYHNLIGSISELICNAEEHAGLQFTEWFTLGCYDKESHVCSFAIINEGNTIYESLSQSQFTTPDIIKKIQEMVENNMSYFKRETRKIRKVIDETLWNVMAIQDGISSKRPDKSEGKRSTRGQGLMEILDFINHVGDDSEQRVVTILSGRSKILIDFIYPIEYVQGESPSDIRRRIVFNKESDLFKPQDSGKVISLNHRFPGTIISGKFTISEQYLDRISIRGRG